MSIAGIVAAMLLGGAVSTAFAAASLTPLGGLNSHGVFSVAHGVSGDGSVVVGDTNNSFLLGEAFRWTSDGGMVGLGGFGSQAFGVSGDGSVVVGRNGFARIVYGGVRTEAFRWTSNGGMVSLGILPGGVESTANDVSDDGSVVVGWNNASATTIDSEAFRWTSAGGMIGLGYLPSGVSSYADAVSADGSVVVGGSSSASGYEAFRWTSAGGMVGLGDLPGGEFNSGAGGVSADGSVIVGYGVSASGQQAFRWTSDGGMVGLGDLPGGSGSNAAGVSGDGSIVVGSSYDPSFLERHRAFYWTAGGGMRALWDVLLSHGIDPAADGWSELSQALDISADGNTIVGYGIRNNYNNEAFVAVIPTIVPEPAAGALALLGVSSILLLRRRCVWRPNKLKVLHFHALAAALMVAIALAPAVASAQADGTVTISGTFSMDYFSGERDLDAFLPGLLEVYFTGHEHTWTLTLHGTSQSHYTNGAYYGTGIQATSFDLEFFGPDAVTLNGLVSEHLAGGRVSVISLGNTYDDNGGGFATMHFWVWGDDGSPGTSFYTSQDIGSDTLFPTDADGYPVVGPEPFSIELDYTELTYLDMSSSTGGYIGSLAGLVTFSSPLPGDFNGDNVVDAADYTVWRDHLNTNTTLPNDLTPGEVTQSDYDVWRAHFGQTSGSGSAASSNAVVPEPAAGALALLGVSSILLLRRRSLWRPIKLKALRCQALAAALTLIAAAPAAAIDTEPLNNSQLTADSLALSAPGTAVSNFAQLGGAGGDVDFFQTPLDAGEVLFGMVTPLAGLPTSFTPPDTVVGVFDDTGARTFNEDDDAGELADIELGYGSVFRFLSPAAADYRIGVSGSSDYEFDGAASGESHTETGGYVLTAGRVDPAVPGGGFVDTDPANQTAAGADLISLTPGTARAAVAELGDADVDFFRVDLHAGDALSAMTAPLNDLGATFNAPDTLIGLFDSSGTNLLAANDDSGGYSSIIAFDPVTGEIVQISPDLSSDFPGDQFGGLGSALRALIPVDGTYYLAVTGAFDDGFSGAHFETGAYALLVGLAVPEPGSALLATVAIAACGLRRVVKPPRRA